MKRTPPLVPLSHDHHHALVAARRLRQAAEADESERRAAVAAFLRFFAAETVEHFRQEEEVLFPTLGRADDAGELLVRALLDHQRIRALVAELERGRAAGTADASLMHQLGEAMAENVRLEERQLFPLIEALVDQQTLVALSLHERKEGAVRVEAGSGGPVWSEETEELNATLLAFPAGGGPREHVNAERDVVIAVLGGSATITIDGEAKLLAAGECVVIEKGRSRSIAAGAEGVRYLSVHRRRAPLQIGSSAI